MVEQCGKHLADDRPAFGEVLQLLEEPQLARKAERDGGSWFTSRWAAGAGVAGMTGFILFGAPVHAKEKTDIELLKKPGDSNKRGREAITIPTNLELLKRCFELWTLFYPVVFK